MGDALKEAVKADGGKVRVDLLPFDAINEVAKVMTFGARKYAPRNWEMGMAWSRLFGAALRHLFGWWAGEKRDPDTGLSPMAHAACDTLFLLAYELRSTKGDDRPRYAADTLKDEDPQLRLCFAAERHECLHLLSDGRMMTPFGEYCARCGTNLGERTA